MRPKKTNRSLDTSVQGVTFGSDENQPSESAPAKAAAADATPAPTAKKRTTRGTGKTPSFTPIPKPEVKKRADTNHPVSVRFPPEVSARLDEEHVAINAEAGQMLTKSEIIRGAILHLFSELDDARQNDDREKYEALWANMGVSFDD